jgi:hypothetical protein
MKKLLLACLIATSAFAGERYLGVIYASTTKSNASANPDGGTAWVDDQLVQPFVIPSRALVSLQCNADMYVATDATSVTQASGVKVPADVLFPTSVGERKATLSTDAGIKYQTAVISILPHYNDGGWLNCKVFERMGNE